MFFDGDAEQRFHTMHKLNRGMTVDDGSAEKIRQKIGLDQKDLLPVPCAIFYDVPQSWMFLQSIQFVMMVQIALDTQENDD